jgi:hypothetical protein
MSRQPCRALFPCVVLLCAALLFDAEDARSQPPVENPEEIEVPEEVPKVDVEVPGKGKRTLIPVPEIIVSPNTGITGGVLGVMLFAREDKTISNILAPDIRYNDITGVWPTLRWFGYPDARQKYFLVAGKATKHGDFFDAEYVAEQRFDGLLDFRLNARRDEDPFERFYGFGNETNDGDETNYTGTVHRLIFYTGVNFLQWLRGSFQFRWNHVRVGSGEVDSVDNLRESDLNDVEGIDGASIVAARFALSYDTRDRPDIPTEGYFADFGVEVADGKIGSSDSFVNYGFELKGFVPLDTFLRVPRKKFILALHSTLNYMANGSEAPFFERNSVGGTDSLRSYGRNRFTDKHRFVMQAELRSEVYRREIFGVKARLELAPFLDFAKVFNDTDEFPMSNLHTAGGLGVRAVVVPQVVAYVDVGTNGDSPAIFTGIDYPF